MSATPVLPITRGHLTLVHSAPAPAAASAAHCNLTSRDMITLQTWARRPDTHGYSRMVVELGDGSGSPEEGGYALIYAPDGDWATWGVNRDGDSLTVWHCASGADHGRYPTMEDALLSLPVYWRGASRNVEAAVSPFARSTVVRLA